MIFSFYTIKDSLFGKKKQKVIDAEQTYHREKGFPVVPPQLITVFWYF